ncbi:Uncharacterised protein [Citrobacter koseri]|uniref:Uncharacterized protein n=1 Tax=Citrobacter koseri TaxID=545 RepID=A0A2X2WG98_CITKO|nr:Uncharacterised protein [Citrobacter koseri]
MIVTQALLQQKIATLESIVRDEETEFTLQALRMLLDAMHKIDALEENIATPVCLPYCSSSPVCEIEAGYAAGVSDCREAIRRAGYPIEGDD